MKREKMAKVLTTALNAQSATNGMTASRPVLGIAKSGEFIVLFWSKEFAGFVLEGSETLTPFPVWDAIATNAEAVGDRLAVSIPIRDTVRFYRLRRL